MASRPPTSRRSKRRRREYLGSLPGDQFPNMVAVADHFAITDQDMRFELLLDTFVEGLARRAAAWESDH